MNVLFLSTQVPHDKSIGGQAMIYRRIRKLHEWGHRIGLAAFTDEPEPPVESLLELVTELEVLPQPRAKNRDRLLLASLFNRVPLPFSKYTDVAMQRLVGDMVERSHYDQVVAEYGAMGQFLFRNPYLPAVRKVLSSHKCATIVNRKKLEWKKYSLLYAWRERLGFEALQQYEFAMFNRMDQVLVLSGQERNELLGYSLRVPVSVIPSGVDVNYFQPAEMICAEKPNLVFTGNYDDPPNRDGVVWFIRYVWPLLKRDHPELIFNIVGPSPSHEMQEAARRDENIRVTGRIDDIRPVLTSATLFVCPMRTGSGLQGKVLEAMSCKIPVVSTSIGVEGLPAQTGYNCFVADHEKIMCERINLLLNDTRLCSRMAEQAYKLAVDYSWETSCRKLEDVLLGLLR